jgi:protein-tyrosine phosphatase
MRGLNGGTAPWMVDCHTHVIPSGDDGAATTDEGRALTAEAARRGTAVMFATPHVWPHLLLTPEREDQILAGLAELRRRGRLDLRLGYELTPSPLLLREDLSRYALEGTDCVLVEVPFTNGVDVLVKVAKHIEKQGLRPVIAHPERTHAVAGDPGLAAGFAERGWILQMNATSMIGHHGPAIERLAWQLLERNVISVVASDGHSWTRPPHMDEAYELAVERLGAEAERMFDGSALGVDAVEQRPAVRVVSA